MDARYHLKDSKPLPSAFENEILPLLFNRAHIIINKVFPDTFEQSPYYPMFLQEIKKRQIIIRAENIGKIRSLKKNFPESQTKKMIENLNLEDESEKIEKFFTEEILPGIHPSAYILFVDSIVNIFLEFKLYYKRKPLKFDNVYSISSKIHQAAFNQKFIIRDIGNHYLFSFISIPKFSQGTNTRMMMAILEALALPVDAWHYKQMYLAFHAAYMKQTLKKIKHLNQELLNQYDPYLAITGTKSKKEIKLLKRLEKEKEEFATAHMFFHKPLEDPGATLIAFRKHYGNWPKGFPYSLKDFGLDLLEYDY